MSIIFYDHLTPREEIIVLIKKYDAPENQKGKALQLVDDILHQGIVDFILKQLPEKHHRPFLKRLHAAPYDPELLIMLKKKIADDIEDQIRAQADTLVKKIRQELGLSS